MIVFILLAGFLPFEEETRDALFVKIENADFIYPSWFSEEVRNMLNLVIVSDPTKRMTSKDMKQHTWLLDDNVDTDSHIENDDDFYENNPTEVSPLGYVTPLFVSRPTSSTPTHLSSLSTMSPRITAALSPSPSRSTSLSSTIDGHSVQTLSTESQLSPDGTVFSQESAGSSFDDRSHTFNPRCCIIA